MRIVALLGNTPDLNHQPERRVLNSLRPLVAETVFPNDLNEVINELQNGCEILYFGGHGVTRDGIGSIEFNNNWIDSRAFANHLSEAVNDGLKLAIFISCEGIGLLEDFHRYNIRIPPFVIVMTGRILDEAAGKFVEVFFDKYTQGWSFLKSFDAARDVLSQWEFASPGITKLPIVYQDFNATNLSVPWHIPILKFLQDLTLNRRSRRSRRRRMLARLASVLLVLLGLGIAIYVIKPPTELAICPSLLHDPFFKEYLSVGGNDLFNEDEDTIPLKKLNQNQKIKLKKGFQAFQNGCEQINNKNKTDSQNSFQEAINVFEEFKSIAPDYYVYSQNAKVYQELAAKSLEQIKTEQPYIITVAVPRRVREQLISQQNTGGEIIYGVANLQNRINNDRNSTRKIILLLADDQSNKIDSVTQRLLIIYQKKEYKNLLLGVIGHAQTPVTKEAAKIYQNNKILLISPTSTGQIRNQEQQDDYIYKVVFDVKNLAEGLAKITKQYSYAPNDKVLVIHSSDKNYGIQYLQQIQKEFYPHKLNTIKIEDAVNLNSQDIQNLKDVKVAVIILTVEDRDTQFGKVLDLVNNITKIPNQSLKKVIISDTIYNSTNLENIKNKELCAQPILKVVTPWVDEQKDKTLKEELKKEVKLAKELYSWRINFAHDSALILVSAAKQLKNNLTPETLKDLIKQGIIGDLSLSSTGLAQNQPVFDLTGNRNINQGQKTSQEWTTEFNQNGSCIFKPLRN